MVMELPEYVDAKKLEERLGETGMYIMEKKYLVRDDYGKIIETPAERFFTVAKSVAEIERGYGKSEEEIADLTKQFYETISRGEFSPGGRILSNAGSDIKSLFNCYVLPIPDDLGGIYSQVRNAAIIHKKGGGTGYNFSDIRPRGTYVKTSHGVASGPVSFAGQFDKETEVINSGNRRGANMGILNVNHPDIIEWVHAKTTEGKLSNFNISVGVVDDFMKSVENGGYYPLLLNGKNFTKNNLEKMIDNIEKSMGGAEVGSRPDPLSLRIQDDKIFDVYWNEEIGRISDQGDIQLKAEKIFDRIAKLAHKTGDPGVIFFDHLNKNNPLPSQGKIKATNPCGEQPLHPHDACDLGSVNLPEMIRYSNGKAEIDYKKIKNTTRVAIRFLDNCNDLNEGPIDEIEETVKRHRRTGLGVMGWADMLAKLEIPYDSDKALDLAEKVMGTITNEARKYSISLAEEKGEFPDFKDSTYAQDGSPKIRNLLRTTIAPTGTIAMLFGCNGGIEPIFAVSYVKNMRGGEYVKTLQPTFIEMMEKRGLKVSSELENKISENHGSVNGLDEVPDDLQEIFKGAHEISPERHVLMLAAFQKHTDNAVSKTINLPNEATVKEIQGVYMQAWKLGCKGTTIYRDKSKEVQVLEVKDDTPEIHYANIEMTNKNIEHNDTVTHYKIKRGNERMHVLITSALFKGKNNDFYFLPHAEFQVIKPIGTELAGEFAQSGIDRTQFLQGPDPNYIEFIRDLKSVRGDRSLGFGPHRIDSPSHAVGLCIEHLLLKQGVLKYDDKESLVQVVRKSELEEVGRKESEQLIKKWRFSEKSQTKGGEIHARSNRDLGIQFKCERCGDIHFHTQNGCSDPVCDECGWSVGKCD